MGEPDDADGLEQAAAHMVVGTPEGDEPSGGPQDERCPSCGRPVDDIEEMDETRLLTEGRILLLRNYVRMMREGTITHQQENIFKTLVLANLPRVDPPRREEPEGEEDNELPPQGRSHLPPTDYAETDGG